MTIQIADIIKDARLRTEYGEVPELAEQIAEYGLIQPVALEIRNVPISEGSLETKEQITLIAGGRRMAALELLGVTELHHGVTSTPGTYGFVWRAELSPDKRRELELFENVFRKSMTWKEEVLAIDEIHTLKSKQAAIKNDFWTREQTGRMVGMKQSNVQYLLRVAEAIKVDDKEVVEAENFTRALQILLERGRKKLEQKIHLLSRVPAMTIAPTPVIAGQPAPPELAKLPPIKIPLSKMVFQGDMVALINGRDPEFVDHIVTDWPYAIDMDNLQQTNVGMNVSEVAAEHDVEENLSNFPIWLAAMYRALKPGGFCIIFCDQDHWGYQKSIAIDLGFSVQRWSFDWVKTHVCQNNSAQYNATKATEIAMMMRKGNATLANPLTKNWWMGDNLEARKFYGHPFAKPAGLWTQLYTAIAIRGQSVLDPFAGRGSSTIPAIDYGLSPIVFELSDNHFAALSNNIQTHYKKLTNNNALFT